MGRAEKWKEPYYLPRTFLGVRDDPEFEKLIKARKGKRNEGDYGDDSLSIDNIVKSCKEIVFQQGDGNMKLSFVVITFDPECLQVCITLLMETVEIDKEGVKEVLAFAQACEIPVLPNSKEDQDHLLELYSELYEKGFQSSFEGEMRQLVLTEKVGASRFGLHDQRFLASIDLASVNPPPAMVLAARRLVERKDADFKQARRFLDEIDAAILDLGGVLASATHREADLQECLQRNPILFGTEYREVIPKLSLGSEYEMDFALRTWNGDIHILEIEDSRKPLFTRKLRPSAFLIHAEQQVLDWYAWIEKFPDYAESRLGNLSKPFGFVIIGRQNKGEFLAIANRNRIFRGRLEILTYDTLLRKAEVLIQKVVGISAGS